MNALTFDTYEAVRELTASGLDEKQAEAVTAVVRRAQDAHLEQLATKGDIAGVKADIERLETKADGELKLVKWMLALIIGGVAALVLRTFFGG